MRILVVQDSLPFGGVTGSGLRNASNLQALRNIGTVTQLSLRKRPEDAPPAGLDYRHLARESRVNIWATKPFLNPLSYRFSGPEKAEIAALIAEIKPDLAVVEGVLLRDVLPLLKAANVPVALDMHNIESALLAERVGQTPWRFWPGNYWRNLVKPRTARKEDIAAARAADQVWVCSLQDAQKLKALSGVTATVVANPVPDPAGFDLPIRPGRYKSAKLFYVGLMTYLPNRRAIETLCRDIVPNLPEGAEMTIAGAMASPAQRRMIRKCGAKFVDTPPDVLPYLAAASYSMMPIKVGGGTRIKALEAMAAGVVIIATEKAVEGLGLQNGVHYLQANTPTAALRQLSACVKAPGKAAEIASNARAFVRAGFGPQAIAASLESAVKRLAKP